MKFRFKGKDRAGKDVAGERDAVDEFTLARDLRKDGIVLFSAEPLGGGGFSRAFSRGFSWNPFSRVSLKDQVMITSNLSSMLSAGLPLGRSLGVLEKQTKGARLRKVLLGVAAAIDRGSSLADALRGFPRDIPDVVVAMVRAGEESGHLPQALAESSENLKQRYQLRSRVRGALVYPVVVSLVMVFVSIIVLVYVVPSIQATFEEFDVELPLLTRIVIAASSFLMNHPLVLGLSAVGAVFLISAALRTAPGKRARDFAILHTPGLSRMAKEVYSATVTRTLSSLLRSGVEVVETISITRDVVQNGFYKDMLAASAERVQKGVSLHAILKEHGELYPSFVGEMAEVGDETGNLPDMLARTAEFYEQHIAEITKSMSSIMEPVMMVVIGIFVGLFSVAVLQPLYSLSSII